MENGFILIILVGIAGALVQFKLKHVFKKYSQIESPNNLTGKDIAEKMLHANAIFDVTVTSTPGTLTDHYNPLTKTVNLSESVYQQQTISALAVATHECGHAIQHARGYEPLKLRSKLVPIVSFSSAWAQIILIAGVLLINIFPILFWLGITMFSLVLLFSIITLPVEIDASKKALAWLNKSNTLNELQQNKAKIALNWAAMTYIVSAISALATLLFYLGFANKR